MNRERDSKREIELVKARTKFGCLIWSIILVILPIILFIGVFSYEMYFKEKTLLVSHSPNEIKTIKIVEKGEPAFFGPSTVRIKYGRQYMERSVANDGKMLQDTNFVIHWENENEATITIDGEEQAAEIIQFNAEDPNPFKENVEITLGSFTFKTSESPSLKNIIQLREVSKSKGKSQYSTVQIFYGERGSVLERYKEYVPSDMYTPDNFKIHWQNDEQVKIEVVRENDEGETYIEEVIDIDLSR